MFKFITIFLALAFGLMAFVSIQDDIPDELGFLKGLAAPAKQSQGSPVQGTTRLEGWTIAQYGPAIEARRQFSGELVVQGARYDVPTLGILCDKGKLDARIEARHPLSKADPLEVSVDGVAQHWARGTGTNIFPPAPTEFVRHLAARQKAEITLPYAELGKRTVIVDTSSLRDVLRIFPASCR